MSFDSWEAAQNDWSKKHDSEKMMAENKPKRKDQIFWKRKKTVMKQTHKSKQIQTQRFKQAEK